MRTRRSWPPIELIVFVVGAASLGAEIAAARLLAPWFGASTIIWANTIATVLVALSAGYWLGGRLADRDPTLAGSSRRYDLIVVDAYRQPYIPFYLATREFFALARRHLTPRGMIVINVGHPERSDGLEKVLSATMGAELQTVVRDPSEATNTMLVGTDAPVSAGAMRAALRGMPAPLRPVAKTTAARLAPPLRGGRVY